MRVSHIITITNINLNIWMTLQWMVNKQGFVFCNTVPNTKNKNDELKRWIKTVPPMRNFSDINARWHYFKFLYNIYTFRSVTFNTRCYFKKIFHASWNIWTSMFIYLNYSKVLINFFKVKSRQHAYREKKRNYKIK